MSRKLGKLLQYRVGCDPVDDRIAKMILAEFFNIADPIYSKGANIGLTEEGRYYQETKYENMSIHTLLLRSDVASIGLSLEEKRLLKEVNIGDVDTERDWSNIGYLNWENRPYKLLPFRPFKISK